jgi:hypothetical protein
METFVGIVRDLREDPKSLLIVLGAIIFIVGVSGGVPYVPISQGSGQVAAVLFGLVLVGLGLSLVLGGSKSRPYGISITTPTKDMEVGASVHVEVTTRGRLPEGHQLWLVRIYDDNRYYPLVEIKPEPGETTYRRQVAIGTGEKIGAFVIGPAGQALIDYQKEAAQRHKNLVDEFKVPDSNKDRYLPSFKYETIKATKTVVCQQVPVKRKL